MTAISCDYQANLCKYANVGQLVSEEDEQKEREREDGRVRAIDRTKESQRVSGQVHCAHCSCLSRMKVTEIERERDERAANYAMTVEAVQISEQLMKQEDGKLSKKQKERLTHAHTRRIRNALTYLELLCLMRSGNTFV